MRSYTMVSISFLSALLSGCAGSNMITYKVMSTPSNAQVDVNGVSMGKTPTEIHIACTKRWVGVLNAPGGWELSGSYDVTVYPTTVSGGKYSQTKRIDPCQWKGKTTPMLEFDLGLQNVAPTQPVEIKTESQPSPNPSSSVVSNQQEILANLKKLHSQGILSDAEYKEKVVKVLDGNGQ